MSPQYSRKLSKGLFWYFQGQYYGKRYCSKAIYLGKKEARDAEREHLKELNEQLRNPTTDLKLLDLMTKRLDEIKLKKSNDYYKENKRYFKKALAFFGDVYTSKITKEMANNLLMEEATRLKGAGKGNMKVNSMIRSLKALFNYGIKNYDLKSNPFNHSEFYPIDINLKYIPTEEEIDAIRAKSTFKQVLLINFVYESGCRINEAVRLKFDDIEGDLTTLYTRKSKNSNLTPRRIPTPECIKGAKGEGKVFKDWETYPRFLEERVKDCGLKRWNWHNLRHARASIWATSGMTTFELMTRLGHSNLQTTMKYLQLLGFSRN